LRVICKRGPKAKIDAAEVEVPVEDTLARTVLKMESEATEERRRLKQQILAAAADHEAAGPQYIAQIRQNAASPQEHAQRLRQAPWPKMTVTGLATNSRPLSAWRMKLIEKRTHLLLHRSLVSFLQLYVDAPSEVVSLSVGNR